jgi:hypothetical protein
VRWRDEYVHGERKYQIIECETEHEGATR